MFLRSMAPALVWPVEEPDGAGADSLQWQRWTCDPAGARMMAPLEKADAGSPLLPLEEAED